ncbi:MAG TPA: DUF6161 domain-containing protein [Melioribacteraceae bacterium]|nr:DUF6161 domain-containing protein [Melioribacteraceae bacterium]
MNEIELKKKEFLDNCTITISDNFTGANFTIKGASEIKSFYSKEKEYWEKLKSRSSIIDYYIRFYTQRINDLNALISNSPAWNVSQIEQHWNNIKGSLSHTNVPEGQRLIYSSTSLAKFIYEEYENNSSQAMHTHNFLINSGFNISNKDALLGYLRGYEFITQNKTSIVQRSKSENKNIAQINNDWIQKTKDLDAIFNQYNNKLEDWKTKFISDNESWQKDRKSEVEGFISKGNEDLNSLKKLYTEKLKLEGPVVYWQNRAKLYKQKGQLWLSFLVANIILMTCLLLLILYNLPLPFHYSITEFKPESIKGLVILATIISLGVFLTRVFTKLTYSSFHLQRDAEEREQLTLIYLALVKEGKIADAERKLVFESIFSRADTGILSGDSSPTMPGVVNIMDKFK